jgi:hypothetical protein
MVVVSMVDMSTFRHVNVSSMSPPANNARNTGISRFKTLRKHSRIRAGQAVRERELSPNLLSLSTFISHIRVIILMNTKMILAAVALSLSLAACAKKEEPAEAAQDAAATATDAAGEAQEAAGDAAAAAGDAAAAAGDAAAAAPAESTPPAGEQPAQPQQ